MATSAIILTHNQVAYTRICVESLLTTQALDEIIFVDNGSNDGTVEFLQSVIRGAPPSLKCKIIRNASNNGGSSARNQGVSSSRGDMLVFLDNDTYALAADWLIHLISVFSKNPRAGVAAPMLVFPTDGRIIQSAGGGTSLNKHFGLLGRGKLANVPKYNRPRIVSWVPTACLMCKRSVFDRVSGFNENLDPMSLGEDIDFCFGARARHFEVWYEPSVKIHHYEGTTFNHSSFSGQKKYFFLRNMRLIKQRWGGFQDALLCSEEEIRYVSIMKDYANLSEPKITVHIDRLGSFANLRDSE